MQETQTMHFFEYSSKSAVVSIEILMEEIKLVVAQNYKYEYRAKSK